MGHYPINNNEVGKKELYKHNLSIIYLTVNLYDTHMKKWKSQLHKIIIKFRGYDTCGWVLSPSWGTSGWVLSPSWGTGLISDSPYTKEFISVRIKGGKLQQNNNNTKLSQDLTFKIFCNYVR